MRTTRSDPAPARRAPPASVPALLRPLAAATGAGLLLPFAFAPYGAWPLAILALAVLIVSVRDLGAWHAAIVGWGFGLGMFGHGVWWIEVSVHQFGVPSLIFSIGITAMLVAGMALYPALFAGLLRGLPAPNAALRCLVLAPALWVLTEWLRGWLFTGFPWLALGYSQIDSALAGFAPLLGVSGCSGVVVLLAGLLAQGLMASWRERALLGFLLIAISGTGAALRLQNWTRELKRDIDVALVQGAIPQDQKWDRELRERSLTHYLQLSASAWQAPLMIWPETAVPAFPTEVPEMIEQLQTSARAAHTTLLIGMPTGEPWNGRYFNSVVTFGERPAQYDKRHLVPFGEFFPFKRWLGNLYMLLSIPLSDFSAGADQQPLVYAAGYAVGVSVCFEDVFGGEIAATLPAAAYLVNVSNDAWFGDTIAPHQHLEIARMRALETGRYMLRATNTGITAVIDDHGQVRARAPQFEPTVLRARFAARSGSTPYVKLGDWPLLLTLALASGATVVHGYRRSAGSH